MPKRKRKDKLPSRVKYDEKCPVLSGRVPIDLHNRAHAIMKDEGLSFEEILNIGVDKLEVRKRDEKEVHDKAYKEGYEIAKQRYAVYYSCRTCKEPVAISSEGAKKVAASYMEQKGWGHRECHNSRPLSASQKP